jgi:hypothetical protein
MKYKGGCHCGKVRYEVDTKIEQVIACNCSICSKKGHLLAFAPEEQFKLLSGEGDLGDYQFNKRVIHHLFCKHCGIGSFGRGVRPDGARMVAINVRCLDDVDVGRFPVQEFDGKTL